MSKVSGVALDSDWLIAGWLWRHIKEAYGWKPVKGELAAVLCSRYRSIKTRILEWAIQILDKFG
jgi:hypothetical protein